MRLITGDGCSIEVLKRYLYMARCNADFTKERAVFHITDLMQNSHDESRMGFIHYSPNIMESLVDFFREYEF